MMDVSALGGGESVVRCLLLLSLCVFIPILMEFLCPLLPTVCD